MDDRYRTASGGGSGSPSPSPSPSASLTGYHVRARALDLASRAKSRAASAYAVASAAAAAAAATPTPQPASSSRDPDEQVSDRGDGTSTSTSASASFARLANGARTKAVSAFERAADAFAEGIDRERERRRSAATSGYGFDPSSEFDDPDTPRPFTVQVRRADGAESFQNREGAESGFPPSGRTSPVVLLRDPTRPGPSPLLLMPVRTATSSSGSPTSPGPRLGQAYDSARKRFAAAGASLSSSNILLAGNLSVRERTLRAFSTNTARSFEGTMATAGESQTSLNTRSSQSHKNLVPVAPGQPLHAPGSEEAILLPGWSVRRQSTTQGLGNKGTHAADIHILLAGVVLRTPETPSRSQRIFLRVAKQIAALPKINSPHSSVVLSDGSSRPRPPVVIPNFSGAPLTDEPSQIDDLSALENASSFGVSTSSTDSAIRAAKGSSSTASTPSLGPSDPSSPLLDPEDLASQPLTDRMIRKAVQGANDDLLLKAMEKIGALPVEEQAPEPSSEELQEAERRVPATGDGQTRSVTQSPTVLGADASRSAHMAEASARLDIAALTDAIPPLSLDPHAPPTRSASAQNGSAGSANTSPSVLRKMFGTGSGDSPSLRATTAPPTSGGASSGRATPVVPVPRSESSSRLTRFAESVKKRASGAPEPSSSLSSSVSSLSSSGGGMSPRSSTLGPFSTLPVAPSAGSVAASYSGAQPPLTWPTGSGVWADRSFDQLLTLQQNLDSRLRAFWTFRVPDRDVLIEIVPVFAGEDERDVQVGPAPGRAPAGPNAGVTESSSSSVSVERTSMSSSTSSLSSSSAPADADGSEARNVIYRPLLVATLAKSNGTGQFNERLVIPAEKLEQYCRRFFSGQDGTPARTAQDIVCLKKRCVLLDPGVEPAHSQAKPGRWVPTDIDDDGSAQSELTVRVISDVDDTVKKSHVTEGVRKIFHSVFVKPYEEVQIPNVAKWYQTLREQAGVGFSFVSNAPLELHGLVCGFLEAAGFPRAHVHLKHYPTGTRNLFSSWLEPAGERKRGAVLAILDEFPRAKFLLIGDSGELDMELYTAIAAERRSQILAIFIRNVSSSMKPDAALQVGNAAVAAAAAAAATGTAGKAGTAGAAAHAAGSGEAGGGSTSSGGPVRKPLFKRNATVASVPTFESPPNSAIEDDFGAPGAWSYSSSSSSSLNGTDRAGGSGSGSGAATSAGLNAANDESRRKREAAFALRVQRARSILPPEIPLLFFTEGEEATIAISLDLIAKARAQHGRRGEEANEGTMYTAKS